MLPWQLTGQSLSEVLKWLTEIKQTKIEKNKLIFRNIKKQKKQNNNNKMTKAHKQNSKLKWKLYK